MQKPYFLTRMIPRGLHAIVRNKKQCKHLTIGLVWSKLGYGHARLTKQPLNVTLKIHDERTSTMHFKWKKSTELLSVISGIRLLPTCPPRFPWQRGWVPTLRVPSAPRPRHPPPFPTPPSQTAGGHTRPLSPASQTSVNGPDLIRMLAKEPWDLKHRKCNSVIFLFTLWRTRRMEHKYGSLPPRGF